MLRLRLRLFRVPETKTLITYGEHIGIFNIQTLKMEEGNLPIKAQELVTEWLSQHKDELQQMWDSQILGKLPPL